MSELREGLAKALRQSFAEQWDAKPAPGREWDPDSWTATGGVLYFDKLADAAIAFIRQHDGHAEFVRAVRDENLMLKREGLEALQEWAETAARLKSKIKALRAQVEALRADAERYRCFRVAFGIAAPDDDGTVIWFPEEIDKAIDKARES